ncbi:unnamed protein product [Leptosia nina]|uniref:Glucuronosyltransferase n=1 Tax=Leptosia nina TaxID=320188 RepID=A0AAV1JFC0_9NEOP
MKDILLILTFLSGYVYCGRILVVVPTPSFSHQVVFRPLTQDLARRGHEVVVVTTDPVFKNKDGPPNLREIDVRDVTYAAWKTNFMNNTEFGSKKDLYKTAELFLIEFSHSLEIQLKTKEVQEIIREGEGRFDVIIVEASVRPALIFSHVFKAPIIQMSTSGPMLNSNDVVGAPSHIFLYPWVLHQRLYNLTLWEEFQEIFKHKDIYNLYINLELKEDIMLQSIFGRDVPSLRDLSDNVDMIFINSYSFWCDKLPVPKNLVYVGGIHIQPEKDLPEDLKSYLDSCKTGIIYVSFGNNVKPSLMPVDKVEMLTKTFSELPYNVLWRWDAEIPGISSNVKLTRWVPQSDLLRHPNVKLFIQQGGINSAEESISAGVPLIGIPMIADQWYTSEKYEYFKIGKRLHLDTLTKDELKNTITMLIEDGSYRENVKKLRHLTRDQPQSALERAVWWTEYVMLHRGAKNLRAPAVNTPWNIYYEIELILSVLTISVFFIGLALSLIIYLCKKITRKTKTQ